MHKPMPLRYPVQIIPMDLFWVSTRCGDIHNDLAYLTVVTEVEHALHWVIRGRGWFTIGIINRFKWRRSSGCGKGWAGHEHCDIIAMSRGSVSRHVMWAVLETSLPATAAAAHFTAPHPLPINSARLVYCLVRPYSNFTHARIKQLTIISGSAVRYNHTSVLYIILNFADEALMHSKSQFILSELSDEWS